MEKILTISVAAYNAAQDIENCLKSMLISDILDMLEIIVVNDGSKDNTAEIVHKYELEYPNTVRLINKVNGGHGSTINETIKAATGKYYKIVDSDDWVDMEGIRKLVFWLEKNSVDLVLNPYYEIDAKTRRRKNMIVPYKNNQCLGQIQPIGLAENIMMYMHSVTFKIEIIKKMGPIIDENCFYVDMEYTIFPMQYVKDYICLEFSVYEYLLGTMTQSMNVDNLIKRRDQHLKVTKQIVEFYSDKKKILCDAVRYMILNRVKLATLNQYKIYFNMNSTAALEEVKEFDKWVKEHDREVYEGAEGRFMKIIKLNQKTDFKLYRLIMGVFRFAHMEPKL